MCARRRQLYPCFLFVYLRNVAIPLIATCAGLIPNQREKNKRSLIWITTGNNLFPLVRNRSTTQVTTGAIELHELDNLKWASRELTLQVRNYPPVRPFVPRGPDVASAIANQLVS